MNSAAFGLVSDLNVAAPPWKIADEHDALSSAGQVTCFSQATV